jgi:hypothetical protein
MVGNVPEFFPVAVAAGFLEGAEGFDPVVRPELSGPLETASPLALTVKDSRRRKAGVNSWWARTPQASSSGQHHRRSRGSLP